MSVDAAREVEGGGHDRLALAVDGHTRQQMDNVREAFRLRRLARNQRYLHGLYEEHSMLAEASGARREMMQLLRTARASWRRALGLAP